MVYTNLHQHGEQYGDQKRRTTDFIWSKNACRVHRIVEEPGNCVFYYLQGEPDRVFVHKKLIHIPEDTQVSPEWVSKWK